MGCDIHLFVEKRLAGKWEYLPAPEGAGFMPGESKENGDWPYRYEGYPSDDWLRDWFDDRNYYLFGILAGVRAYDVAPIAEPRGWPDDLSPELETERGEIEHTPTWLTVAEMQARFTANVSDLGTKRFEYCLHEMIEAAGTTPDNIRAVFYFDS